VGRGVYLALSARLLLNLESLNMAESVGNVTKHRKAPIVIEDNGSYKLVYAPVVSGMSLAHHYQRLLARAASERGLPVSRMSLEGFFMKYADDNIIKNHYPEVRGKVSKGNSPCVNERIIVESDVVADVGGFLYTDGLVKRTSRFSFSYLIPALDSISGGASAVYPQIHVRYTPTAREGEQALIYVDTASALYTLSFILEASEVSVLGTCKAMGQKPDDLGSQARRERVRSAVEALVSMLGNASFGAKRSRSMPHWRIESMVVVASTGLTSFVPSPGHSTSYLAETLKRLEAQKRAIRSLDASIHYYAREKLETASFKGDIKSHDTPEKAIIEAAEWVLNRLG